MKKKLLLGIFVFFWASLSLLVGKNTGSQPPSDTGSVGFRFLTGVL